MFLYGPPGTGKTSIANRITEIYNDYVWVPHAVEVDNQIITVFDAGVHRRRLESEIEDSDRRWVLCHRPCVITGGELTGEMLELQFNPVARYYSAPLQMKANNGIFVLDDFGRQRMRPQELLNRWMTALDRRVEYLALPGGRKFEIPFDTLVVFSTNLRPVDLVDEAFLRRVPNKVWVSDPTPEQYREILARVCRQMGVPFSDTGFLHLLRQHYQQSRRSMRACHPRDLLRHILALARYYGVPAALSPQLIDAACHMYFLGEDTDANAALHLSSQQGAAPLR